MSEKGSNDRVLELLILGYDVLIREYEKDGAQFVYERPNEQNREKGRLFMQCYDQEEPLPAHDQAEQMLSAIHE